MAKRTCSVDGCERVHEARGLCRAHYARHQRTGSAGRVEIGPARVPRPPRGVCSIEGCDRPHDSLGYCGMHYQRLYHHGDPVALHFTYREDHPQWKGDSVAYRGAHRRITRLRGPASSFVCEWCDRPALHWAYDHLDPDALVDPESGCLYSTDMNRYLPLCQSCHVKFDNQWRRTYGSPLTKGPDDGHRNLSRQG